MTEDFLGNTTLIWRLPFMEDTLNRRWNSMKEDLQWKVTFKWDNPLWKTSFDQTTTGTNLSLYNQTNDRNQATRLKTQFLLWQLHYNYSLNKIQSNQPTQVPSQLIIISQQVLLIVVVVNRENRSQTTFLWQPPSTKSNSQRQHNEVNCIDCLGSSFCPGDLSSIQSFRLITDISDIILSNPAMFSSVISMTSLLSPSLFSLSSFSIMWGRPASLIWPDLLAAVEDGHYYIFN